MMMKAKRLAISFAMFFSVVSLSAQQGFEHKNNSMQDVSVSSGIGYRHEWKNDRVKFGSPPTELTSPNTAFIYWVNLNYTFKSGWFGQASYDREYTIENDLEAKIWLRSLHFSIGKSMQYGNDSFNLFAGLSSVKRISFIGSMIQVSPGNIEFELSEGSRVGYIFPHLGIDYFITLTKSVQTGFRIKTISNFSDFGRIDFSAIINYTF